MILELEVIFAQSVSQKRNIPKYFGESVVEYSFKLTKQNKTGWNLLMHPPEK